MFFCGPRRRRRLFWTGGAPPPPTEIDRRAAADTMTSAHSSKSATALVSRELGPIGSYLSELMQNVRSFGLGWTTALHKVFCHYDYDFGCCWSCCYYCCCIACMCG